ncbi:MAG: ABC transporter substrate-binding protein [Thermoproteota archaeon]|nr:ABC transporter substrate-binding protein [Candidatus Brockarchaeota archaeon]
MSKKSAKVSVQLLALIAIVLIVIIGGVVFVFVSQKPPTPHKVIPDTLVIDTQEDMGEQVGLFGLYGYGSTIWATYQPLVWYNLSNPTQVLPLLAERWDISSDGMTYTFYLRKGIKFHNGDPFNAYAVWWSYYASWILGPSWIWSLSLNMSGVTADDLNHLTSLENPPPEVVKVATDPHNAIQVVDEYTIRFHLIKPYRWFLSSLASGIGLVCDPLPTVKHGGIAPLQYNPYTSANYTGDGTGPYKVVEFVPHDHIILEKAENYWGNNLTGVEAKILNDTGYSPGFIKRFVCRYRPDPLTRVNDLRTGAAQIITLDPSDFGLVQGITNVTFPDEWPINIPAPNLVFATFNTVTGPTSNKLVRQAIVHAINYSAILEKVYLGRGTTDVFGPNWIGFPFYNPEGLHNYEYNITLAKELLAKAGYPDGKGLPPIKMDLPSGYKSLEEIALIVQSNLADIGIQLDIVLQSPTVFYSSYSLPNTPYNSTWHQIGLWGVYSPDFYAPNDLMNTMLYEEPENEMFNPAGYYNPEVNKLLVDAMYTLNDTQIKNDYIKVYRYIYEDVPYIYFCQMDFGYVYYISTKNVAGIRYDPTCTGVTTYPVLSLIHYVDQ